MLGPGTSEASRITGTSGPIEILIQMTHVWSSYKWVKWGPSTSGTIGNPGTSRLIETLVEGDHEWDPGTSVSRNQVGTMFTVD